MDDALRWISGASHQAEWLGQTARSFTYDAAGDILTDSRAGGLGMTFQYDTEGRLSRAFQTNAPTQGGTYAYDAMNRLASRIVTSGSTTTTTLYVHDTSDHIIAETDSAGATRREYIWLNDLPIAVVDGVNTASPTVYYVHTDHLGRPARMVAQNWAWVWDVIYSPFGGTAAIFDSTAKLDMRFPGQWFQLESGLAYNWHRHYDATLGRYVQPDPIGYAGGRSLYGYVGQNALAYVDRDGQNPVLIGAVLGGVVGALSAGVSNVYKQKMKCPKKLINWTDVGGDALAGFAGGAILGALAGSAPTWLGVSFSWTYVPDALVWGGATGVIQGMIADNYNTYFDPDYHCGC